MTLEQLPPGTTANVKVDVLYNDTEGRFFAVEFQNRYGATQALEIPYASMGEIFLGAMPIGSEEELPPTEEEPGNPPPETDEYRALAEQPAEQPAEEPTETA
jgi:hypothetical protein